MLRLAQTSPLPRINCFPCPSVTQTSLPLHRLLPYAPFSHTMPFFLTKTALPPTHTDCAPCLFLSHKLLAHVPILTKTAPHGPLSHIMLFMVPFLHRLLIIAAFSHRLLPMPASLTVCSHFPHSLRLLIPCPPPSTTVPPSIQTAHYSEQIAPLSTQTTPYTFHSLQQKSSSSTLLRGGGGVVLNLHGHGPEQLKRNSAAGVPLGIGALGNFIACAPFQSCPWIHCY